MFDKLNTFYQLYNVQKTIIITSNDLNEFNLIKDYLDDNLYTTCTLEHVEDYNSNLNIQNIISINTFKTNQDRVLLMSYSTWYNNKKLIKNLILSNNLFVIGDIFYENINLINSWITNVNKDTYFLTLF